MKRRQYLKFMAGGLAAAVTLRPGLGLAIEAWTEVPKCLWVWHTPLSAAAEVMATVRQFNISCLLYSITPTDRAALFAGDAELAAQILAFREMGIAFVAVSGDPAWCRRGGQLPGAVYDILNFQSSTRIFHGLCLDINPQTLPEWRTADRDAIIQGYSDLLALIRQNTLTVGMPLGASVVPEYANIAAPGASGLSLLQYVASSTDATALLAYRNTPDAALSVALQSAQQLDSIGKLWVLGVTVEPNVNPAVSYAGFSPADCAAALLALDSGLRKPASAYWGIAINAYPYITAIS